MKHEVRVTVAALAQIEQSAAWWAERHSLEQALRWLHAIHEEIASLADHPERCGLARESPQFVFDVRELLFGMGRRPTHRVLFRIVDGVVEVLLVRHVAQDQIQPDDV